MRHGPYRTAHRAWEMREISGCSYVPPSPPWRALAWTTSLGLLTWSGEIAHLAHLAATLAAALWVIWHALEIGYGGARSTWHEPRNYIQTQSEGAPSVVAGSNPARVHPAAGGRGTGKDPS